MSMTLTSFPPGPLTVDDLDGLPGDGRRHELIDGVLVMSPAPKVVHQAVAAALYDVLRDAQPADVRTFFAPVDFRIDHTNQVQPDLLVLRWADVSRDRFVGTPRLVVEILSPSTRRFDLLTKMAVYADAGVPDYWVVDPDEPSVLVHRLVDGTYRLDAAVRGQERVEVTSPFRVELCAGDLLDGLPVADDAGVEPPAS